MLFFEKWSDHHHAAMQVRRLRAMTYRQADTPLPSKSERSERRRQWVGLHEECRGEIPVGCCQQPSVGSFLIFKKGDFTMQAKKINPEKTKNPEVLTLDSTYRIGNRSFIVEPVFKEESSQTLGEVLLRLMKSESEKL